MKATPEGQLRPKDVRNWTRFASLIWEMVPPDVTDLWHMCYAATSLIPKSLPCWKRFDAFHDSLNVVVNGMSNGVQGKLIRRYMSDSYKRRGHDMANGDWGWRFLFALCIEGSTRMGVSVETWRDRFEAVCPARVLQQMFQEHLEKHHPHLLKSIDAEGDDHDPADAWKLEAEPPRPTPYRINRLNWEDPSKN